LASTVRQLRKTTIRLAWSELEDGVTWAAAGTAPRGIIRLMAERLRDGSWTWTTWRAIAPTEFQSGFSSTREAACVAAENAAAAMAATAKRRFCD